ncbi:hypothetical protein [Mycolicibacterium sphagni]|uniref:hypothetical protein n=1 Tax=Mycolicibacterium sphagni TaxID=1786 RepID=UPI0021F3B357|nr:hypothetical protein [Mycolicibacterium sphagni]MCV7175448.1 hypothetical protein [Mycolicibacterium sphagni]
MDDNDNGPELPDALMAAVPRAPETHRIFRLAQMLLLLDVAKRGGRKIPTVDRLGYYEFLADSPFIVIEGNAKRDEGDRLALELAGFVCDQLAYASSGHRFASRRRRIQHDLSQLISYGLIGLGRDGYEITANGMSIAGALRSVYADAYRVSADIVLRRLSSMSNSQLGGG